MRFISPVILFLYLKEKEYAHCKCNINCFKKKLERPISKKGKCIKKFVKEYSTRKTVVVWIN